MAMKLLFNELSQSDYSGRIHNDGWFPVAEIELVEGPDGRINAILAGGDTVLVTGTMNCGVRLPCDRCCEPVNIDLIAEFSYECIFGSEDIDDGRHEKECREEELNRIYLEEPVIDIGAMCREQLYLALPSRVLCDESCKGLCPRCGADLNSDPCECESTTSASPFSVLRQLSER
ncbi:MAG: DUF177 domain-containing protein [Desulfofustis sp.]|nr:DUF177 domain-containing protein [Desulfofustis sp.]